MDSIHIFIKKFNFDSIQSFIIFQKDIRCQQFFTNKYNIFKKLKLNLAVFLASDLHVGKTIVIAETYNITYVCILKWQN